LDQLGKEAFDYTGFISDVANESHQTPRKSMPEVLTCSRCGMTYDFFRKHGKFGCQHCYDAFEPMITPMIRRMHGKDRHVGKVIRHGDERFQRKREMEALQAMLDAAVEREEYELAAVYRDQIKALVRTMDQVED
jgi:protein arginine kinase activator